MVAGRKPKPIALHLVEGTFDVSRHSKRLKGEPKPVGDLGDPPAHLSEAQKAIWVQQLKDAPPGLLKKVDWADYLTWVVACDIHRQALEDVNRFGTVMMTRDERYVENPNLAVLNRQALIMMKASELLGFSPVARARVAVDPKVEANPFDEFR